MDIRVRRRFFCRGVVDHRRDLQGQTGPSASRRAGDEHGVGQAAEFTGAAQALEDVSGQKSHGIFR